MKTNRLTALSVVLLAAASLPASAQNTNPQLLAFSCQGCHGGQGKSPGTIPAINGRSADQIAAFLRDFRDGKRPSTVMIRLAKGYTDDEIDALAKEVAAWK